MSNRCWLPKLEYFEAYQNSPEIYLNALYLIFKTDFITGYPLFKGKQVTIRKHPMEFGKEEAFFHTTCQDYTKTQDRLPDFRRCERIRWVRAFIENYDCDSSLCEGVKVWEEPYKNKKRVHILLKEERYMVVLEPRESYCLLITAFYFDQDHALKKKLKHYDMYRTK